jgi:hypothetical protein
MGTVSRLTRIQKLGALPVTLRAYARILRLVAFAEEYGKARILRVCGIRGAPAAQVENRTSIGANGPNVLAPGA